MPLPLALVLLYHNVTIFYQKLQDPKPYKMTRKYGLGFGYYYHYLEVVRFFDKKAFFLQVGKLRFFAL